MLSTDSFEFGTSANALDVEGCGVEMGDAVLGMVAAEMGDDACRAGSSSATSPIR